MPVPGADHAVIEPLKLRDYFLSPAHPVGRFKAAFFASLGYTQETWGALSADLQQHALAGDAQSAEQRTTRAVARDGFGAGGAAEPPGRSTGNGSEE